MLKAILTIPALPVLQKSHTRATYMIFGERCAISLSGCRNDGASASGGLFPKIFASSMKASESRSFAAHNLVERGLLIRCDNEGAKQLRFVSMRPDIPVVHPQIRQKIAAPELIRMLRVLLTDENTIDAENDAAQQLHAVVGLLAASGLTTDVPH